MKILIAAPIDSNKEYAWNEFSQALTKLNSEVLIVDNSEVPFFLNDCAKLNFKYIKEIRFLRSLDRVVHSRNTIRAVALGMEVDYLLMLDADVIVPEDIINKLISRNVDIVSGVYSGIHNDLPVIIARDLNYDKIPEEKINGDLLEVGSVGLGCCLIKGEVLSKIRFRCERSFEGAVLKLDDQCFCESARKKGYKIYLDTSVSCRHLIIGNHWADETMALNI